MVAGNWCLAVKTMITMKHLDLPFKEQHMFSATTHNTGRHQWKLDAKILKIQWGLEGASLGRCPPFPESENNIQMRRQQHIYNIHYVLQCETWTGGYTNAIIIVISIYDLENAMQI